MPTSERVLCVPAGHVAWLGEEPGFRPAAAAARDAVLDPAAFTFRPRAEVETDPDFRQLIPYVVLVCGDRVFHYRRGAAGTETRLAARRSVGVGGHIADTDAAGGDPYRAGMARELAEEVAISAPFTERFLGFIYDPRTPVGVVHLGVVHLLELNIAAVEPREAAIADAGFAPLADLLAAREEFETWSQFVLDELRIRVTTA